MRVFELYSRFSKSYFALKMTFISHFSIHLMSPGKETDAVEVKPEVVVVASTSLDSTEQGSDSSLKDPLLAVGDIIAAQIVSAEQTRPLKVP
jgi:hypothetical protein